MRKQNRRKKPAQKTQIELLRIAIEAARRVAIERRKLNAMLVDYAANHPQLTGEAAAQSPAADR